MNKISKNEKGFSAVEFVLVIVVVALIGVGGWLVYKNHHKATTSLATTSAKEVTTKSPATTSVTDSSNKTYKDPSNEYTVSYPVGWTVAESPSNGLSQSLLLDLTEARFTPANLSTGAVGNTWIGISSFKSGDVNMVFQQESYASGESYNPTSLTIDGYTGLYHQEVVPVPTTVSGAMGYTNDYYAVTHNNITLVFYFQESASGSISYNATSFVPAYTALVKSVKFLN